ncbi:endoribonuclease ysh1, partial [Spiromyces aspiralis]
MGQLRAALQRKFAESSTNMKIYTPANIEPVELHFRGEKMVKVYGGKSYKVPEDGDLISGVLVHKDFKYTLIDPTDLNDIIDDLAPTSIMQSQVVPYRATFSLLMHYLEQMYGVVEEVLEDGEPVPSTKETSGSNDNGGDGKERDSAATAIKDGSANKGVRTVRVYDSIDVHYIEGSDFIELEWESDVVNDMIADSIIALVLNIECSPASVKLTKSSCQHGYSSVECVQATRTPSYDDIGTKRERLLGFLSQQFTQLELSEDKLSIIVTLDNKNAAIDLHSL